MEKTKVFILEHTCAVCIFCQGLDWLKVAKGMNCFPEKWHQGREKSQSQWIVKVTLSKLKEMIQTLSLTSHPSQNQFLFWQGAFSFGVTWKKGINQQSSSNSNYLLLETACLSMEKQKYPRNILITNMQISRLAGAVFSPLRSVPPCLHCPLAKCWTDGHRFWVSTLPMGTGNCTSLWDSVAHSHVWHGGGGCCTTLPGILSFLDWRSTAEGSDMPCVKASVRGAGR